jgi:hypothetical protein
MSKSKTPLFASSVSRKGQAKPALSWSKGNETPRPDWFSVGFSGLKTKLCLQTQIYPAKSRFLLFATH